MTSAFPMNGQVCTFCNHAHAANSKCDQGALISKITNLLKANQLIPNLMKTNKEVTDLANVFRNLAHQTSVALNIAEEVVKKHADGELIWGQFKEELEKAWQGKGSSSQDTKQLELDLDGKSISNVTEDRQCTLVTASGETIDKDSLQ